MKKIYVGNLSWDSNEQDLRELFEQFGTVHSVAIVMDRDTGRSRGFGFVEMDESEAQTAISKLNGREFDGRTLNVNEAREKTRDSRGGGGRPDRGGAGRRAGGGW